MLLGPIVLLDLDCYGKSEFKGMTDLPLSNSWSQFLAIRLFASAISGAAKNSTNFPLKIHEHELM